MFPSLGHRSDDPTWSGFDKPYRREAGKLSASCLWQHCFPIALQIAGAKSIAGKFTK